MTTTTNPRAVVGNNQPPDVIIFDEIQTLFDEAKNWADGDPITSEEQHDAVTKLYDGLHDAGKRADELRKEEKKPLDDEITAIQGRYNPYIQPKKGKVDLGKDALGKMLAVWRAAVAKKKEEEARKAREEADAKIAAATAAIRESSGNLAEREVAEQLLTEAKQADRFAKRQDKAATTGTGLRTVWVAAPVDWEAGLDWAYGREPVRFKELVQQMANEAVRSGARSVPGFVVSEEKRAA